MSKERRASGTPGCVAGGMLSIWFPLPGPHGGRRLRTLWDCADACRGISLQLPGSSSPISTEERLRERSQATKILPASPNGAGAKIWKLLWYPGPRGLFVSFFLRVVLDRVA